MADREELINGLRNSFLQQDGGKKDVDEPVGMYDRETGTLKMRGVTITKADAEKAVVALRSSISRERARKAAGYMQNVSAYECGIACLEYVFNLK